MPRVMRGSVDLECPVCGKTFRRWVSAVRERNYCSASCRNTALFTGPGSGKWKGGTYIQAGYRMVKTETGYVQEHRLVLSQSLGRPLLASEEVHHINGDKLDNRPENLMLTNRSEHARIHSDRFRARKVDWTERGKGCDDCGEAGRPHYAHGVCERCYQRRKAKAKKQQRSNIS